MRYTTEKIDGTTWKREFSEAAHAAAFGEIRPRGIETADFALVCFADDNMAGYVQCIEMDKETVYWQMGGAFTESKGNFRVVPCYMDMVTWCLERYKRITTRIENENISMLHLAMKMGFRVCGTWNFGGRIYLELLNEREIFNGN
ncbi:hypothetical protein CCP2SC5_2480002 [Azospirillaceae bacterium]